MNTRDLVFVKEISLLQVHFCVFEHMNTHNSLKPYSIPGAVLDFQKYSVKMRCGSRVDYENIEVWNLILKATNVS